MESKVCKECGAFIRYESSICPICGAKKEAAYRLPMIIFALTVILILVGLVEY